MTPTVDANHRKLRAVIRHQVPYLSQWESPELVGRIVTGLMDPSDDPRWQQSGARSPQDYAWWAGRICGMACIRMAIAHWQAPPPPAVELARDYLDAGAYRLRDDGGLDGLIYREAAAYTIRRFGLGAVVAPELTLPTVDEHIRSGGLAILSVHKTIRTPDEPPPTSRGGHLVLAVGAGQDTMVLHNPSGLPNATQQFHELFHHVVARYFAGRGILLTATSGP